MNKIKVRLTESLSNYGEAGEEIQVYPNEARELAIQGRIEGDLADFAPEVLGQEGYRLRKDRLVDAPSKDHDHSHVLTDDEGRIVGIKDFDE
jgi:hypothetical protein